MSAHLVPLSVVNLAASIVDDAGFAEKFGDWERVDQKYRGGRPATLNPRAVVIAYIVVGFEQQPLYMTRVAEVLSERLSEEAAAVMGLPPTFLGTPYEDVLNRVERVMNRILEVFDFAPLPERRGARSTGTGKPRLTRQRRLTKAEFDLVEQDRRGRVEEMEMKHKRIFRFANDLLHAQYDSLPEAAKTHKLSLVVDATFLDAPSRPMSSEQLAARAPHQTVPLDFDAGFYVRDPDKRDSVDASSPAPAGKHGYGYENELVVLVSNDPNHKEAVPHIAVGFNFHVPSVGPQQSAREVFDDILEWGHGFGHISADGLYLPGANPETLQKPLRAAGAMLTMRYGKPTLRGAKGETTTQAEAQGAHMVEGRLMCPVTPRVDRETMYVHGQKMEALRRDGSLTKDEKRARKRVLVEELQVKLQNRNRWELILKETKWEKGVELYACPAAGPRRSLECPLKPNEPALDPGVVPLPVLEPPRAPGPICTNKSSVTVSMEVGAKYRQHYRYGSPEWTEVHTYARQTVESYNKLYKHADNMLKVASSRQLRGAAGQQFLSIIAVVALNARIIIDWQARDFDETRPAEEPRTRRSRTNRRPVATRPKRDRPGGMSAGRRARYGLLDL